MFKTVTPESVGISSEKVLDFYKFLDDHGFQTHDVIMARGDKIFTEGYWAPFHKDFQHRMYSVSKSFVGIAVGLAEQEGLLSLDDKLLKYFPEYEKDAHPFLKEQTLRDMLKMSTSRISNINWFASGTNDRCDTYFQAKCNKVSGSFFDYDSPGSFMLNSIVEKVTGMPFLEYLYEKALKYAGFSEKAYCLKCPGGHSFGDSGVMCTARDLLTFARFVMDKGNIDGKNYVNEEYITQAVKKQCSNNTFGFEYAHLKGYGYQIWKMPRDGFAFIGMGDQFAVCDPETDFIFIINSDNQGEPHARPFIFDEIYRSIVPNLGEPLPENEKAHKELLDYVSNLKLYSLRNGEKTTKTADEINGVTYKLEENSMGIEWIRFEFEGEKGKMFWKNAQGEKELPFGMGYNEFAKFPQEGYSDMIATYPCEGNMYDAAISAIWDDEIKLIIKAQIIDKYFGRLSMSFAFKDGHIMVRFNKTAEAFLNEYEGFAIGKKIREC